MMMMIKLRPSKECLEIVMMIINEHNYSNSRSSVRHSITIHHLRPLSTLRNNKTCSSNNKIFKVQILEEVIRRQCLTVS